MYSTNENRRRARDEAQKRIDAASLDLSRGAIGEAAWCDRVTGALASAYLLDDDPRWQSGFDGDAELWRQARALVLEGVDRDGAFLDIGCATGHLMECLAAWALERGHRLEMYGLELNPELAATARRRLPAWSERIWEGNAIDWTPPRRFTFARAGLEYAPAGRGSFLAARLLRDVVEPGGRLIIGPVDEVDLSSATAAVAAAGLGDPVVRATADRNGKRRCILWVERPGEP